MTNLGSLDRRITIQSATETQQDNGELSLTWSSFASLWAKKDFKTGGETFEADELVARNTVDWVVRYYPGITEKMRIIEGTSIWDILYIAEDGRERFMILKAKKRDNEAYTAKTLDSTETTMDSTLVTMDSG